MQTRKAVRSILIALTSFWWCAFLSCAVQEQTRINRVELISDPEVHCVLLTDIDSLAKLIRPETCAHVVDCSVGYSSIDTSFAIGFVMDTISEPWTLEQLLNREVHQRQLEKNGQLHISTVVAPDQRNEIAYGYYDDQTHKGSTAFFFGLSVQNGFVVRISCQLSGDKAHSFAQRCFPLLLGVRVV